MKHKHAELIKAWADGAEVEFKSCSGEWVSLGSYYTWDCNVEFRIKPEPKPDVIRFVRAINGDEKIKLIFDGETGKLKSAEVVE
jgi:hypothetical protein